MSHKAREMKVKMNYRDFIRIKISCRVKEKINKTKRQLTKWEKVSENDISAKGIVTKMFKKNFSNSTTPQPKKSSEEKGRKHEQAFFQRHQDGQKMYERYSASLMVREIQIKTTMKNYPQL